MPDLAGDLDAQRPVNRWNVRYQPGSGGSQHSGCCHFGDQCLRLAPAGARLSAASRNLHPRADCRASV